jgi:predicted nicotinamide N-methyase
MAKSPVPIRRTIQHFNIGEEPTFWKSQNPPLHLRLRKIQKRQIGNMLWGSSILLSEWIHAHSNLFEGRTVLELGSGLGLCGLVAGHYSKEVTLTDFDPILVNQLSQNIDFNRRSLGQKYQECKAKILDWDRLDQMEGINYSDIIIGSEIVHEPLMGISVFKCIDRFLKKGGLCVLMLASSKNRFGMDKFLECLRESGFKWTMELIPNEFKLKKLGGVVQEDMNEIYLHIIEKPQE